MNILNPNYSPSESEDGMLQTSPNQYFKSSSNSLKITSGNAFGQSLSSHSKSYASSLATGSPLTSMAVSPGQSPELLLVGGRDILKESLFE